MKRSLYRFSVDGKPVLEAEVSQEELETLYKQFQACNPDRQHTLSFERLSD